MSAGRDSGRSGYAEAVGDGAKGALSFEQSIQRLAAIVESLESGEQPLEESLRLFEEGMGLARRSQRLLEQAEQRIEQLLAVSAEGELSTRELTERD